MRNLSSTSFKHACKLSLVLLICASFVLQTNITKPLAETLYAPDSANSLSDLPEETDVSAAETLPNNPDATSEDLSQSMNSERTLAAETSQSDALGAPFTWNPSTNVLTIQGDCKASDIKNEIANEASAAQEVCFSGDIAITTDQISSSPFRGAANLARITALDGAHVSFAAAAGKTNPTLRCFFNRCANLTSIDGLASWDVSNVSGNECMYSMFDFCTNLTSLNGLASWNVSRVTGDTCMYRMFASCTSLTSLTGLASWNVSNVAGNDCMRSMFDYCKSLNDITGIASWNLAKAKASTAGVKNMFVGCSNITYIKGASTDASGFVPTSAMSIPTLVSANNFYSEQAPTTPVSGDTLLANWPTYASQGTWTWKQTVTFDANGGVGAPSPELVVHNAYATQPTPEQNPTRVGYTFVNWYTDETGTTLFDFSSPISANTVVYAKWAANTLTATFDLNGGEGTPPGGIMLSYGEVFPTDKKPVDPTRAGYSFDGWYTEATEGSKVEWGTTTVTQTDDFVLYAHWLADPSPSGDSDDIVPAEDVLLPQTGDATSVLLPLLFIPAVLGLFAGYAALKRNEY